MSEYKTKGKLSFKGDRETKKKKKRKAEISIDEGGNQEGWVFAEAQDDLIGPLFLIFNSESLFCLYCSEKDHSIGLQPLPVGKQLPTCEPEDIPSVFIGSRIIGSTDRISLKTFDGKYLASDKFGVITAEREAIGPQEEWTPVIREDGIALQSSYEKFLSVDEIAGGGYSIRADVETIGFCETWRIKCQARFRKKVKNTKKETKTINEYEIEQMYVFIIFICVNELIY
ncbi:18315_t:CDS:2 [Funneliformis geosporum]|nr:18315_t:CDS:2 [Funneliformis geosporum]